jgi:hypothetical protein
MTRSLLTGSLLVAAGLLVAPAAWAMDAPIQEGGGNNVGAVFRTPAPAPSSAPATMNAPDTGPSHATAPFNPAAYKSTTDCLNAAAAAHESLGQCEQGRSR